MAVYIVSLEAPDNRFLGSVTTDFSNYVNLGKLPADEREGENSSCE